MKHGLFKGPPVFWELGGSSSVRLQQRGYVGWGWETGRGGERGVSPRLPAQTTPAWPVCSQKEASGRSSPSPSTSPSPSSNIVGIQHYIGFRYIV